MDFASLLIFASALLVAAGTPGPSIAALVARVIARGVGSVLPFLLAMWVGEAVWLSLAVFGLAFVAQTFHLGNARRRTAVLQPAAVTANWFAIAAVVMSVGLQMLTVTVSPLADVLQVAALDAREWVVAVALGVAPALIGQAIKLSRDVPAA